jgi:hypothetical protein
MFIHSPIKCIGFLICDAIGGEYMNGIQILITVLLWIGFLLALDYIFGD